MFQLVECFEAACTFGSCLAVVKEHAGNTHEFVQGSRRDLPATIIHWSIQTGPAGEGAETRFPGSIEIPDPLLVGCSGFGRLCYSSTQQVLQWSDVTVPFTAIRHELLPRPAQQTDLGQLECPKGQHCSVLCGCLDLFVDIHI
jgi:hypothetical protein